MIEILVSFPADIEIGTELNVIVDANGDKFPFTKDGYYVPSAQCGSGNGTPIRLLVCTVGDSGAPPKEG